MEDTRGHADVSDICRFLMLTPYSARCEVSYAVLTQIDSLIYFTLLNANVNPTFLHYPNERAYH